MQPQQVFEFDIYADPLISDDIQSSYAVVLRDAPDIFWSTLNGGHRIVQHHDLIAEVVKNPTVFYASEMQIPRVENTPFFIPLSLDSPENVPYRHVLMPKFSPQSVAEIESKMRTTAAEIVAEVADKGACGFIHDVAARFPVSVFMVMMGLPLDKLQELRAIADKHFNARTAEEMGVSMGRTVRARSCPTLFRWWAWTGSKWSARTGYRRAGRTPIRRYRP